MNTTECVSMRHSLRLFGMNVKTLACPCHNDRLHSMCRCFSFWIWLFCCRRRWNNNWRQPKTTTINEQSRRQTSKETTLIIDNVLKEFWSQLCFSGWKKIYWRGQNGCIFSHQFEANLGQIFWYNLMFLMGQSVPLLSFIFSLLKQASWHFLQQMYVKKSPSNIRCWD